MADFQVEGPELKKLIAVAKRQPIAFAFNPGKNDEDHYLAMDRKKASEVLGRDAKKSGEGSKVAFGMATVSGKVMSLKCETVVPGMAKKLKRYLKTQKLSLNIEVLDENGVVLESDITDIPDEPGDEDDVAADAPKIGEESAASETSDTAKNPAEAEAAAPAPDMSALMTRLNACKPRVQAAPAAMLETLTKMFTGVVQLVKKGDAPAASERLAKLEQTLVKVASAGAASKDAKPDDAKADNDGAASAPDRKEVQAGLVELGGKIKSLPDSQSAKLDGPFRKAVDFFKAGELEKTQLVLGKITTAYDTLVAQGAAPKTAEPEDAAADPAKAEWEAIWPGLVPLIDAEIAPKGPMWTKLNAAKMMAEDAAAAGDFKKAVLIAKRLEESVPKATAARLAAEDASKATMNSVDFSKTRLNWGAARSALKGEMKKLADAIVTDLKGGDVEGIETAVEELYGYLDPIDDKLEAELDKLISTSEPAAMATLRDSCLGIISTFRQELNQGIFAEIDDNNGFASVSVQKNAVSALDAVAGDIAKATENA